MARHEYPTEEEQQQRAGNDIQSPHREESEDDNVSMSSSAKERAALKEEPGKDIREIPKEHSGFYVMIFFVVFSFISFALMLTAACPVAWYKAKNRDIWTLWKDNNKEKWTSNPCSHKKQLFQAMEAYTIISVVFCLAALIAGILQMVGKGHLGVTMTTGFLSMSTTLVSWALCTHQYHKYNCPGEISYSNKVNRLNAGFSLSFISFCFMLLACVDLGYYMLSFYGLEEASIKSFRPVALVNVALIAGCLTITTVANAFTMWENYYEQYTVKVTLWHVEVWYRFTGLSEFWSYKHYHCSGLNQYFRAGQAFGILSAAFLFFTLLCCVASVYNRMCKWLTIGFGAASWVFLLIVWAIMVGARYKTFCKDGNSDLVQGMRNVPSGYEYEQRVDFTGFVITEGLGMFISAWCAMTVILVYYGIKA